MPALTPSNSYSDSYSTMGLALMGQVGFSAPKLWRPIEYFGGVAVSPGDTCVDNLAAFTEAFEWSNQEGGGIILGAGEYGVDGTLLLLPYVTMIGVSERNTMMRQLSVATDALGSYATLLETPDPSEGGGFGSHLERIHFNGGWEDLREYEGAGGSNWNYDITDKTTPTIQYWGSNLSSENPNHATLRALDIGQSDSHHRIINCQVSNSAGPAIKSNGRGEHRYIGLTVRKAAANGLDIETIDITQMTMSSVSAVGNTGVRCSGGAYMIDTTKSWFCGLNTFAEPAEGAAFKFEGTGKIHSSMTNCAAQDTYGPSVWTEGRCHRIEGLWDNPGGGRIEQQGLGWQGTRTLTREWIRIAGANSNRITGALAGGTLSATAPKVMRATGTSSDYNFIDLIAQTNGLEFEMDAANPVDVANSIVNNGNYNEVKLNGKLLHGRMTTTQLTDATHHVNYDDFGPSFVHLENDGFATKGEAGDWTLNDNTTITPV